MNTQRWIIPICRTAALVLVAGMAFAGAQVAGQHGRLAAGSKAADENFPRAVLNTHELMEHFNQPIYRALRRALTEQPSDEQQWKRVEHQAHRAAEVANLIALRDAAEKFPDWLQRAKKVQLAAVKLAEAAKQKDYQSARQAYVGLIQNCNRCHQSTRPEHAPQLKPFGGRQEPVRPNGK